MLSPLKRMTELPAEGAVAAPITVAAVVALSATHMPSSKKRMTKLSEEGSLQQ